MYSFQSKNYTGVNRCWPCTVTNLVLAIIIASALFLISPLLAAAFFVVSIFLITFIGYLVPGTPYLTRQYFPERVLACFEKVPPETPNLSSDSPIADIDWLIPIDLLSLQSDKSLSIDPVFKDHGIARIESLRGDKLIQRELIAGID